MITAVFLGGVTMATLIAIEGPTGIPWLDWVVAISVFIAAAGVIWKKAVKPIVHGLHTMEDGLPVLVEIAREFKHDPNGESLKDILTGMKTEAMRVGSQLETVIAKQDTTWAKLDELHSYSHETRHQHAQELQKLALQDNIILKRVEEIAGVSRRIPESSLEAETVDREAPATRSPSRRLPQRSSGELPPSHE